MLKIPPKLKDIIAAETICYRNICKEATTFEPYTTITKNFHLELGDHNETVIVEDRPDDWFEIAQKDTDKVGLANILDLARRKGEDPYDGTYSFKDDEALDLGDFNPNDPESIKSTLDSSSDSLKKLEGTASRLGISVQDLINSFVDGTLSDLISKKLDNQTNEGGAE